MGDSISRQAAISEKKMQIVINNYFKSECNVDTSIRQAFEKGFRIGVKKGLAAQPERVWTPCDIPPEHHRDVIVRGVEAIGNVPVYKIMQWDVDTWRPADYAPSITWLDWCEI